MVQKVLLSPHRAAYKCCRVFLLLAVFAVMFVTAGCGESNHTVSNLANLVIKISDSVLPIARSAAKSTPIAKISAKVYQLDKNQKMGPLYAQNNFTITDNRELSFRIDPQYSYVVECTVFKLDGNKYGKFSVVADAMEVTKANAIIEITAPVVLEPADSKLVSIAVSPQTDMNEVGQTQQFKAMGTYDNGLNIDITTAIVWSSSKTDIVKIQDAASQKLPGGWAELLAEGNAAITAFHPLSGLSNTLDFKVVAPVAIKAITVSSEAKTLPVSCQCQFTAIATMMDGSSKDITNSVVWVSSDESVAKFMDPEVRHGMLTAQRTGSTKVTATEPLSAVSSEPAEITVSGGVLSSIEIMPDRAELYVGSTQAFNAIGHFSDGSTLDMTNEVTWTSLDDTIISIDSLGVAKAVKVGSAQIFATDPKTSWESTRASITVKPSTTITLRNVWTPAALGDFSNVTAMVGYSDGSQEKDVPVTVPENFLTEKTLQIPLKWQSSDGTTVLSIVLSSANAYNSSDTRRYAFEWWYSADGVAPDSSDPNAFDIEVNQFAGGEGTASSPSLVANPRQLANIQPKVDNFVGYYKQISDIDFGNSCGLQGKIQGESQNDKIITFDVINNKARFYQVVQKFVDQEPTGTYTGLGWNPIGGGLVAGGWGSDETEPATSHENYTFRGVYDGDNHIIDGVMSNRLYVKAEGEKYHRHAGICAALFGTATDATIKNLTTGSNCFFRAEGPLGAHASGFLGRSAFIVEGYQPKDHTNIVNCTNRASVCAISTEYKTAVGGFIGWAHPGNLTNCTNFGTVISVFSGYNNAAGTGAPGGSMTGMGFAGGLIGYLLDAPASTTTGIVNAKNCVNNGRVYSYRYKSAKQEGAYAFAAGLIGYMYNGVIENSVNNGEIVLVNNNPLTDSNEYVYGSGIVGELDLLGYGPTRIWSRLYRCANYGNVSVDSYGAEVCVGGVVACGDFDLLSPDGNIVQCGNTGNISGLVCKDSSVDANVYCGGIMGSLCEEDNCIIEDSYNSGQLTATNKGSIPTVVGGLLGYSTSSSGQLKISHCYSAANNLLGSTTVGGLLGKAKGAEYVHTGFYEVDGLTAHGTCEEYLGDFSCLPLNQVNNSVKLDAQELYFYEYLDQGDAGGEASPELRKIWTNSITVRRLPQGYSALNWQKPSL